MASSYSIYDPNKATADMQAAYSRLLDMQDARQKYANQTYIQAEKQRQIDLAMQQNQDWKNQGTTYGSMAQGALTGAGIGTLFGPGIGTGIGALIGGGAGLLLGGINEVSDREAYKHAHGDKNYDLGSALKDTFLRAPTGNEMANILPAAGAIAGKIGGADAQKAQNESDMNDMRTIAQQDAAQKQLGSFGADASNPLSSGYQPPPLHTGLDAYQGGQNEDDYTKRRRTA